MSWRSVPPLLRHCVVAVYNKSTSGGPDGVVQAFKICRDKLAQQGYLAPRGHNQILESIQLTAKGYLRSMKHGAEGGDGDSKDLSFAKLYKMVEPRLWEYDGPGGQPPPKNMTGSDDISPTEEAKAILDTPATLEQLGIAPPKTRKS